MKSLVSQKQLAEILNVSLSTVQAMRKDGAIVPDVHEGGTVRYNAEETLARLKERAKRHAETPRNVRSMMPVL